MKISFHQIVFWIPVVVPCVVVVMQVGLLILQVRHMQQIRAYFRIVDETLTLLRERYETLRRQVQELREYRGF